MLKIAVATALALACGVVAWPAGAQYGGYDDGYRRPPRGYDEDAPRRPRFDREDDRRFDDRRRYDDRRGDDDRRRDGFGRQDRGGRESQPTGPRGSGPASRAPLQNPGRGICATPRGACDSPAGAPGSGCVCFVPDAGNVPGTMR